MGIFHLFNSFPVEIKSLIYSSCPPNDQVCLRLTCKLLYTLAPSPFDTPIPLDSTENKAKHLCGAPANGTFWERYIPYDVVHRKECHKLCNAAYNEILAQAGKTPVAERGCRTNRLIIHCECYAKKLELHLRLKTWMPEGLLYCRKCQKFTRRLKAQGNRCHHGRQKPRHRESHYWTHRPRGGGFGIRMWKKWFNNQAMDRYESRLRMGCDGTNRGRGAHQYSLRTLPPKEVNSVEARDRQSGYTFIASDHIACQQVRDARLREQLSSA